MPARGTGFTIARDQNGVTTMKIDLPSEYSSYYKKLITDGAKRDLLYWLAENQPDSYRRVIADYPGEIERLGAYGLREIIK